jgi:hypothetical protein
MVAWTGIAGRAHSREDLRYPSDMRDTELALAALSDTMTVILIPRQILQYRAPRHIRETIGTVNFDQSIGRMLASLSNWRKGNENEVHNSYRYTQDR